MPTLVTYLLTDWLTDGCGFRAFQTKPDQTYLTYLPDLLSWPTWATSQPDIPTHLTYPPICLAHLLDLPTHPDNLPEPTDNLPEPIFTISTKFHNLDQISEFRPNFRILTQFQNYTAQFQNYTAQSLKFFFVCLLLAHCRTQLCLGAHNAAELSELQYRKWN